ncbi:hypothetical protein LXA43DRAFT_321080 [Ganoderma leucocontextum]|nr:hypothetical protein LXA43DRAFT_321080 [Ganoderma leucocontextum]
MGPRTLKQSQEHAAPSLNLDVFQTVLNHLSVADLKQIAVVSHIFHEEAVREILTRGVRFRGHATKLQSFCHFMLRQDPPLFPLLHSVDIELAHRSPDFNPNDLLEVLSRATHLCHLRICWTGRLFTPDCDERLTNIIPKLQHLRHLRLLTLQVATDKHVAEIVLNLRSQLDTFDALCRQSSPFDVNQHFPHNLGEHQTHLRVLRIGYPDLTSTPWVPLPSVRTLELLWPRSRPISLRHIAQTFPCLRELAICLGLPGTSIRVRGLDPDQVRARDEALAFQRQGGGWKSLDVLVASTVPEAWVLCLTCLVRSVRLGTYHAADHAAFVDVVSAARPRKVTVALSCTTHCVHPEGGQSVFLFPTDAGPGTGVVTHAVVFLKLHIVRYPILIGSVEQNTSGILETVGSHVKHSRLEYLHVAIAVYEFGPEEYAKPEWEVYEHVLKPSSVVLYSLRPIFGGIDIELLVSQLAAAGEHLRVIALTISARGQHVWSIDRKGGGLTIHRIMDSMSAREIIEREERSYMY